MIDFIIASLDWMLDIEQYHPRKCYFVLGLICGLIIKYG